MATSSKKSPESATTVEVEGRRLRLTNLDKVLYPATGFTKGQVIDYYARIAPAMLPHLADRPLTMVRLPDGVAGERFFEKRCPGHRPQWLDTVPLDADSEIAACSLDSVPALVWTANLAALELHTPQARAAEPWLPSAIVFDLDPGPATDLATARASRSSCATCSTSSGCVRWRRRRARRGCTSRWGSGRRSTRRPRRASRSRSARCSSRAIRSASPSTMAKEQRGGRVFVDWSQNDRHKTTVCAYSLRATDVPGVSTPVSWDEIDELADGRDPREFAFTPTDVLARVDELGDLYADSLAGDQDLPELG